MKVALVVPETLRLTDTCAPLNLACLASYLRLKKPYVTVKIIDGVLLGINVMQELSRFQPDIVGVTATTPQAPSAYSIGDMLKKNRPDIYTVMGGVHASALPSEAALHFDCVVVGEGEQALVNIIDSFEQGKRLHGIIIGEPVANLDDVPMPAYDLIRMDEYLKHGQVPGLKLPVLLMVTSRGCLFACPFCYNSNRKYPPRWFSAARVVDELEYLLNHYKIGSFFFSDDEFLINKKRLAEIGRLLEKRDIKIVWGCQARVNTMNPDTLLLAKKMGCAVIIPGFESMAPRILKYLKRGTTTVEANERALMLAEKAGIMMGGCFIFGTPTETMDEMKVTFNWLLKHGSLKFVNLNSLVPFPGTAVYKFCQRNGLLPKVVDYERFVQTNHIKETYVIDNAVDLRVYSRFMLHAQRITWILSLLRCGRSFRSLINDLHLWYILVYHPIKLFKMLQCRLKYEPIIC